MVAINKRSIKFVCVVTCILLLLSLCFVITAEKAYAYFDRGTVGVSVGQSSVSVTTGSSATVSVSLSPATDSQLPGCGMAECPQVCGEQNCLDANGQCMCAGTTYQTYTTSVSASSSNTSVASVSYSGGAVTIRGISKGSATITITASLRQFRNGSKSIQVTVNDPPSQPPANSENNNSSGSTNNNTNNGAQSANSGNTNTGNNSSKSNVNAEVNNGSGSSSKQSEANAPSVIEEIISSGDVPTTASTGITEVMGRNGVRHVIADLDYKIDTQKLLSDAMGKSEKLTFKKVDTAGNVVYSISFVGTDIESPVDLNLVAELTDKLADNIKVSGDAITLNFEENVYLPATAEVNVAAGEKFSKESSKGNIDIYQLDASGKPVKIAEGGSVMSGYVAFDITNTNNLIITDGDISSSLLPIILIASSVVVIIAIVAVILVRRTAMKKKSQVS